MEFEIQDLRDQNPWWKNPELINEDIKIKEYEKSNYKWDPKLKTNFKTNKDIIYTLRGPRQVGKTTLIKLLIKDLLNQNIKPKNIFYYTCDLLTDQKELHNLIKTYLNWIKKQEQRKEQKRIYILLDEISSVKNWQKALKLLKDTGKLQNTTTILTGSHSIDIKKSGELLPGRRGKTQKQKKNQTLLPMKFSEYLETTQSDIRPSKFQKITNEELLKINLNKKIKLPKVFHELEPFIKDLNNELHNYLLTGGFPITINDYHTKKEISYDLFERYTRVVVGDIYKQGKKEAYLRDICDRIIETRTSRVGWNTLKKGTSIKHHDTIKTYVELLKESFVLNVLYNVDPNKKKPRKAAHKKIYFSDPFIYHSIKHWIHGYSNPYNKAREDLEDPILRSQLIEETVANHMIKLIQNINPSELIKPENKIFYWSNGKEVDFILKHNNKLLPYEVGYQENVKGKGKWIKKRFGNPIILTKNQLEIKEDHALIPISLFLFFL